MHNSTHEAYNKKENRTFFHHLYYLHAIYRARFLDITETNIAWQSPLRRRSFPAKSRRPDKDIPPCAATLGEFLTTQHNRSRTHTSRYRARQR